MFPRMFLCLLLPWSCFQLRFRVWPRLEKQGGLTSAAPAPGSHLLLPRCCWTSRIQARPPSHRPLVASRAKRRAVVQGPALSSRRPAELPSSGWRWQVSRWASSWVEGQDGKASSPTGDLWSRGFLCRPLPVLFLSPFFPLPQLLFPFLPPPPGCSPPPSPPPPAGPTDTPLYSRLPSLLLSSLQDFVPFLSPSRPRRLCHCFSSRRCDREEQEAEEGRLGCAGGPEASTEQVMLASSLPPPPSSPLLPLFSWRLLSRERMRWWVEQRRTGGPCLSLQPRWEVEGEVVCI